MDLAYDRYGSGAPLLLVHGIGSRRGVWEPVSDRLAAERDVIAPDLPGFGDSPPLPGGTRSDVDTLTDAMVEFVEKLGLDRPHVAGNSLGGAIALELARRGAVRSATALSPIGFWSPRETSFAVASLRASRLLARLLLPLAPALVRRAAFRTLLFGQIFGRPWRLSPETALADLREFVHAPAFDITLPNSRHYMFRDGGELRVPVTIAWGTRDRLLIPRQAERAKKRLPRGRHVPLAGCGHTPMVDDPERVAALLLQGSAG